VHSYCFYEPKSDCFPRQRQGYHAACFEQPVPCSHQCPNDNLEAVSAFSRVLQWEEDQQGWQTKGQTQVQAFGDVLWSRTRKRLHDPASWAG
jgi:hypothetical protein